MRLTGRTKLAGIMGWPIGHSRSPVLHNFWLEEQGIDGVYVPLPVRPEQLGAELAAPTTRITVQPWGNRDTALAGAGLLVNTTSLGMAEQPELKIDLSQLPLPAVVVDIVYVPLETALLAAARRRGHCVVDGLGMLLHQGRPGFEAWFGAPVRVTRELRAAVLTTLSTAR